VLSEVKEIGKSSSSCSYIARSDFQLCAKLWDGRTTVVLHPRVLFLGIIIITNCQCVV
jgi:hypothetical protein